LCGQVIVVDPDVAQHVTVIKNHPKHDAERWFTDPLIGVGNIVTVEGPRWKYLHRMLSPAFAIQHISKMRPAVGIVGRAMLYYHLTPLRLPKRSWNFDR
jgi:cytochrome P450